MIYLRFGQLAFVLCWIWSYSQALRGSAYLLNGVSFYGVTTNVTMMEVS